MIPQFEPFIKSSYADDVKNQILSGYIGCGKKVEEFENLFAEYVGSKNAIAVTSGTAALMVSMIAIGLVHKTVLVPNYSFIAPTQATSFLQNRVYIADIKYDTLSINPAKVEKHDNIIFVDHNGYVGEDLLIIKDKSHILIEDAACALGIRYKGKHAGTFGDLGCFSFSVPKLLTTGQGGMIVTDENWLAKRCREIIDQGSTTWRQDKLHRSNGVNFKFNNILASYGIAQLKIIDELLEIRENIYNRYIYNGINLHNFEHDTTSTWMNILMNCQAEKLQKYLLTHNIETKIYYKSTYEAIGYNIQNTIGDKAYQTCLYLPSSLNLTIDQIDRICDKIYESKLI